MAGHTIPGPVLDLDATLLVCHSDKEQAAKTWTHGYHPLLCFLDATGEALSGLLRAGNAGSNTAADHITVLDLAGTGWLQQHAMPIEADYAADRYKLRSKCLHSSARRNGQLLMAGRCPEQCLAPTP